MGQVQSDINRLQERHLCCQNSHYSGFSTAKDPASGTGLMYSRLLAVLGELGTPFDGSRVDFYHIMISFVEGGI